MDERRHVLLHIGVDAQPRIVGHGDDRLGRRLAGGGVLHQRARIGEARRHLAVERRDQPLIGFERAVLVQRRLGDAGVGIGLIGLLGGDGVLAQQLVIALGDVLLVDQVGAWRCCTGRRFPGIRWWPEAGPFSHGRPCRPAPWQDSR